MSNSATTLQRGLFIVFEGCDRCGKSTQSRMLTQFLEERKVPVQHLNFPARNSEIGKVIDAYLRSKQELSDQAIHLLFSANRWEAVNKIRNLLESGVNLVVDRYSYSGVAYSAAKGLNFDWCMAPEKGLIRPDLVFYLKAPMENLAQRGSYGKERYEKQEFQQKVAEVFNKIYKQEKHYWIELDAATTKELLHEEIVKLTLKNLDEIDLDSKLKILN